MSYILEALKKLEQKREQEEAPQLFGVFRESRAERKKRALWPYVLAGALLLNAVVMVWWMGARQGEKKETPAGQTGASQPPVSARREAHVPSAGKGAERPYTQARVYEKERDLRPGEAVNSPVSAAPDKEAQEAPAPQVSKAPEAARPPAGPEVRKERPRKVTGRVLEVNELPAAVRGGLPTEFRISGHAYTPEPQTRVARINEKILQEGQDLAPGLRLEEIVPGGVIFGYQGYHFRVGLSGNR
ncbi:MAG: general secretion pathway protein GspB [Syntrophorhabdales bacterium]|jgi:general secretion pathway protein B